MGHQAAPEGGDVASFPAYGPDHPHLQWAEAEHQCRQQAESGNGSKFEKIKIILKKLKKSLTTLNKLLLILIIKLNKTLSDQYSKNVKSYPLYKVKFHKKNQLNCTIWRIHSI